MSVFQPDWPLPSNVKALCTERGGGVSGPPYESFNLATHVGDNAENVESNRQALIKQGRLPSQPVWLDQQHTDTSIQLNSDSNTPKTQIADASWTTEAGVVSVVMTADCLPVLLAAKDGSCVAAVHAGWKGLAKGIISKTIAAMPVDANELTAWIGPAISARQFEVGQDVYDVFSQSNVKNQAFFQAKQGVEGKYLADLASIAELEMEELGVDSIYQSKLCTFEEEKRFFSYRRDNQTGRIASLIWLEKN